MYKNKTIVVIIPAYNEEKNLGHVIDNIPPFVDKVIVVNDGSNDGTEKIAREKGAVVVTHPINKGVGAAFHSGIKAALMNDGDVIVNIDADGQFNPKDILVLINPIIKNNLDFVTASRFKDKSLIPKMPKLKIWGNKKIAFLVSLLTGKKFYDVSCGFRAYSRDTALKLTLFGKFTYTQETFLDLAFKGANIAEIPIAIKGERENGESRVAYSLLRYAIKTTKIIFRTFRDYKPLRFFGMVSLPFLVIGIGLEIFLISHYIFAGTFTPHKWAGFSGLGFFVLGLIFFIIGIVADMLDRIRSIQEELLYYERKREYDCHDKKYR